MKDYEEWNPSRRAPDELEDAARSLLRRKYAELQQTSRAYNAAQTMKQREYYLRRLADVALEIGIMSDTIWKLDILTLKEIEHLEEVYHV